MSGLGNWLAEFSARGDGAVVDGLIPVRGYSKKGRPPEEVAVMEKALRYRADAVFFEAPRNGRVATAQAFLYRSDELGSDTGFARLHRQLWSWGGVPLVYRVTGGLVQLFRCAHRPDFDVDGRVVCRPFKTLDLAARIAAEPWWDADRIRKGTLWDDPGVCGMLLSGTQAAQMMLIEEVRHLYQCLNDRSLLPKPLRRRLLILSILIAYLEQRNVFEDGFFGRFKAGAEKFFEVLSDGPAVVALFKHLERRFNGHLFVLDRADRRRLRASSTQLTRFANLVEGRQEPNGQRTLWQRYSFADLPVELISHIYQLFVQDTDVAVYTPHFVVRLMLGEVLSWDRLDRLEKDDEAILDPACGSGIFLVEAYKRLVLHWRYRNDWRQPDQGALKQMITRRLIGVDKEEGAVDLAAFSLCLALCDSLEPEEIRASVRLFPPLKDKTLHTGCFFEAIENNAIAGRVGVVVGNPPFVSRLETGGAERAYAKYRERHGALPDRQVAYLFLHASMELLRPGGVLSMLQQYNFLYNQRSLGFRRHFLGRWDVREILDLISIRGLFRKGGADTKVVVVVAEARSPQPDRMILHATFRRSGRADAEQGFDIDYYDMHWLPRSLALADDNVWRANSVGGGRVLAFVNRLKSLTTFGQYARRRAWDFGEGWIRGERGNRSPAEHITGKPWLPSESLTEGGIAEDDIRRCDVRLFKSPYTPRRFTPPMLLIRSQSELHHAIWNRGYLTYTQRIVGFCARDGDAARLRAMSRWLDDNGTALRAYVAATSPRVFTQKSSALSREDIVSLPFDESGDFRLAPHEELVAADIVDHYQDMIRRGQNSRAMREPGASALPAFNEVFTGRINGVYRMKPLRALGGHAWQGVMCQPYVFGEGRVAWDGASSLARRVDALLREKFGAGVNVTRVARVYDGACIYLLKPDRLRYWLRSVALRDADETLADLAQQGF